MDLHSPKDKILLKNCILVKLQQLKLEKDKPNVDFLSIINEISYYENLYQLLKSDDTETLISTLNDAISKERYIAFNKQIFSASRKDLAEEYIDLTRSLMVEKSDYKGEELEQKFNELKDAFYKGNEDLIDSGKTKNVHELEEEPSSDLTHNFLTETQKEHLSKLELLFKQYDPKAMSSTEFNEFSEHFRDLVKLLGISKFQPFFDEKEEKIIDMQIYRTSEFSRPMYKTEFSLANASGTLYPEFVYTPASTSGFTSDFYQTLCHSYIEANHCTRNRRCTHNCFQNEYFFRSL